MKLTPNTITEHHVIECNSEKEQIATFETLIKMGWKVNDVWRDGLAFRDGQLSNNHSEYPNIRWGVDGFQMTSEGRGSTPLGKPSVVITLNDLADLNETKMYNK